MSRLTFNEGQHVYWLADRLNGKKTRVPSVSSLKSTLYQFAGERWYVQQAATALADQWDAIADTAPPLRAEALERAANERISYARDFGRAVHHYAEHLWTGEPQDVPEQYAGHVQAIAEWWTAENLSLIQAEGMCYADADGMGMSAMAGRFDLMVMHPLRGVGLLDIKTWTSRSSGQARTEEWAFQLAAYSTMEFLVTPEGEDTDFPYVNWQTVLHVGPGGLRAYELTGDQRAYAEAQVDTARLLKATQKAKMTEVGA